jgi:hypothetical protein
MAQSLREQLQVAHSMIGMPYEHNLRAEITSLCEHSAHQPALLEAAVVLLDSYGRVYRGTPQPSVYVAVLEACAAARTPGDAFADVLREPMHNPLLATARKLSLTALEGFCPNVKDYGPDSAAVSKLAAKLNDGHGQAVTEAMTAMVKRLETHGRIIDAYSIVRDTQGMTRHGLFHGELSPYTLGRRLYEFGCTRLAEEDKAFAFAAGQALCTANGAPKDGFHLMESALALEFYKARPDWEFIAKASPEVAKLRHLSYAPHMTSGAGEEFAEIRDILSPYLEEYVEFAQRAHAANAPAAAYGLMYIASVLGHHERTHALGNPEILVPFNQSMASLLADHKPELGAKFLALGAYTHAPYAVAAYGHGVACKLVATSHYGAAALYFETASQLARLAYTGPYSHKYTQDERRQANAFSVECSEQAKALHRQFPQTLGTPMLVNAADYTAAFKARRLAL